MKLQYLLTSPLYSASPLTLSPLLPSYFYSRCSKTEQQLVAMREADGDGDGDDDKGDVEKGEYPYPDYRLDLSSSSLTGLQKRRGGGGGGPQNRKVLADLEQMGVRTPATVARAVDMIDSWTFMIGK